MSATSPSMMLRRERDDGGNSAWNATASFLNLSRTRRYTRSSAVRASRRSISRRAVKFGNPVPSDTSGPDGPTTLCPFPALISPPLFTGQYLLPDARKLLFRFGDGTAGVD